MLHRAGDHGHPRRTMQVRGELVNRELRSAGRLAATLRHDRDRVDPDLLPAERIRRADDVRHPALDVQRLIVRREAEDAEHKRLDVLESLRPLPARDRHLPGSLRAVRHVRIVRAVDRELDDEKVTGALLRRMLQTSDDRCVVVRVRPGEIVPASRDLGFVDLVVPGHHCLLFCAPRRARAERSAVLRCMSATRARSSASSIRALAQ